MLFKLGAPDLAVKTLFLGFDGSDRRLIGDMIGEGELPDFAARRARLAAFEVENDPGLGNVRFWTSAAIRAALTKPAPRALFTTSPVARILLDELNSIT